MKLIRKISILYHTKDMHFSVGQEVYGGHVVSDIVRNDDGSHSIMILNGKTKEIMSWKKLSPTVPVIVEHSLKF